MEGHRFFVNEEKDSITYTVSVVLNVDLVNTGHLMRYYMCISILCRSIEEPILELLLITLLCSILVNSGEILPTATSCQQPAQIGGDVTRFSYILMYDAFTVITT